MNISILMPVYNGARLLDEALASVAGQLGPDDELLVQDGGSADATVEIVESWRRSYPQLSIVSEQDDGQTDALQRALARASGDVVGWLNADDVVAPGALDAVRVAAQADPRADLIYGSLRIVNSDGQVRRTLVPGPIDVEQLLRHGCYLFTGATYYRRRTLVDVGFDTELHYCMDFDLLLRLAARPGLRTVQVPDVLGVFRYHEESKTGASGFQFVKEAYEIRRRTVARLDQLGRARRADCVLVPTALQLLATTTARLRYAAPYSRLRDKARVIGR